MARLIDADRFKNWLMENYVLYDGGRLLKDIDKQPTVDAEPVRHGHWDTEVRTDRLGMKHCYYACSVCGRAQDGETPFCALCGAKMDGGEDASKKETD